MYTESSAATPKTSGSRVRITPKKREPKGLRWTKTLNLGKLPMETKIKILCGNIEWLFVSQADSRRSTSESMDKKVPPQPFWTCLRQRLYSQLSSVILYVKSFHQSRQHNPFRSVLSYFLRRDLSLIRCYQLSRTNTRRMAQIWYVAIVLNLGCWFMNVSAGKI